MTLDADRLRLLCEHYQDSCLAASDTRKIRDRASVWALVLLVAAAFERAAPGVIGTLIGGLIAGKTGGAHVDLAYVSTFVWLGVLALMTRYFQATVRLDRDYDYVHTLERLLAAEFPAPSFTREGVEYLRDYPLFSSWVHFLYNMALPFGVGAVALSRASDVWTLPSKSVTLWCDLAISLLLLVTVSLYLWTRHGDHMIGRLRALWERIRGRSQPKEA